MIHTQSVVIATGGEPLQYSLHTSTMRIAIEMLLFVRGLWAGDLDPSFNDLSGQLHDDCSKTNTVMNLCSH